MKRLLVAVGLPLLFSIAAVLAVPASPARRWTARLSDRWSAETPTEPTNPLEATFNDPAGIWIDPVGTVFFSDRRDHLVRALTADGLISIAGNGRRGYTGDKLPATRSRLNFPEGLAGDGAGNLYIADSLNHRIRSVDAPRGHQHGGRVEAGLRGGTSVTARSRGDHVRFPDRSRADRRRQSPPAEDRS